MPLKTWIGPTDTSRSWTRGSPGRRATDRLPSLEQALGAGVVFAWTWSLYELVRLYIR